MSEIDNANVLLSLEQSLITVFVGVSDLMRTSSMCNPKIKDDTMKCVSVCAFSFHLLSLQIFFSPPVLNVATEY